MYDIAETGLAVGGIDQPAALLDREKAQPGSGCVPQFLDLLPSLAALDQSASESAVECRLQNAERPVGSRAPLPLALGRARRLAAVRGRARQRVAPAREVVAGQRSKGNGTELRRDRALHPRFDFVGRSGAVTAQSLDIAFDC